MKKIHFHANRVRNTQGTVYCGKSWHEVEDSGDWTKVTCLDCIRKLVTGRTAKESK